MPAFVSPLDSPAAWTLSIVEVTIPPGLRYGGYKVRGLRAQHASANVVMPALGIIRRAAGAGDSEFVEIQVDPFPIQKLAVSLAGGLPTFYLAFPDATGITVSNDQMASALDAVKNGATDVTIVAMFQDRITRDPALWAGRILAAINAIPGSNSTLWSPFSTAIDTQTNSGDHAPVLYLDHAGQPITNGSVELLIGGVPRTIAMDPADLGDLQRAVVRINAADPGLWAGGVNSFLFRPVKAAGEDCQVAILETSAGVANEVMVTKTNRHILATKVTNWFANQFAVPTGQMASPLARYTRDNEVKHLVNGPEYFEDLFHRLQEARTATGRFDLVGWSMFADVELAKRLESDPADFPLTLEEAVTHISAAGGSCRLLPSGFLTLEPGAGDVAADELLVFHLIVSGILIFNAFGVDAFRTDPSGIIVLTALLALNAIVVSIVLSNGGQALEPSAGTVELLEPLVRVGCALAPYPAHVADNTARTGPQTGFPFDTIFKIIRHFGVYHQKFAIVKTDAGHFGFCGGIDLNPDRLDDANHLSRAPYHDVHTRVQGPAIRDLAISFEERWTQDGTGDPLPVSTPVVADLGAPGSDIVQVARTYFKPADASRALAFAPQGDRTIADSMLAGIAQAREFIYIEDQYLTPPEVYRNALIAKVANSEIKKLVIVIPGLTDQPFGEIVRSGLIASLRAADEGRGIVQVGYPRRRFTISDNELRSRSGKCTVGEAVPQVPQLNPELVLTPASRLPPPPFWVAVEGELMWVFDEAPSPPTGAKRFKVVRGADTRLIKAGATPAGTSTRAHAIGAPATVLDLSGIYVHAKMMIVDDVFMTVGSANLNRRGLFHDGEINIFTMPQALRTSPGNPISRLRRRLWAEMMDLPVDMAAGILEDPVASAKLFDRSYLFGNRFVDVDTFPNHLMFGATTGDALVGTAIQGFITGVVIADHEVLFDAVVDPSSSLEP